MSSFLLPVLLLAWATYVTGIWTKYALVNSRPDSFGSEGHTSFVKISAKYGNGPQLNSSYFFGCSVANLGDLDGDGNEDIAVGSKGEPAYYNGELQVAAGAVYILFLNSNVTVKSYVRIGGNSSGGPHLVKQAQFGYSIAAIGDLDEDGVVDIVVGAPGTAVPTVYIIYLQQSGYPKSTVVVRGKFLSRSGPLNQTTTGPCVPDPVTGYCPNGPPVTYLSYFGSMVAPLGDFNGDGILDIAVGAMDASSGNSKIYFLYMYRNGTVNYYSTLASGYRGGPIFDKSFVNFGSSLALIGDIDGDGYNEIAIGAKGDDDNFQPSSGAVFICFMNRDGSIKRYERLSQLQNPSAIWPSMAEDECGAAVLSIGDINLDHMRQQHPQYPSSTGRPSIPDVIMGCPQTGTGFGTSGKLMVAFLDQAGAMLKYYIFPEEADPDHDERKKHLASKQGFLPSVSSQLGASLAPYPDKMGTGIKSIVAGAPGDADGGGNSGAVYVIYLRRLEYHRPMPCTACYYGVRVGISIAIALVCFGSCAAFFYIFRRRPDEIEIAVKKAGLERKANWERKRQDFNADGKVYADSYET